MITITLNAQSAQELQSMIDNYKREYHPAGYGTSVDKMWTDDAGHHATLSRYSSCD